MRRDAEPRRRWSLFSNHGIVLVFVARQPESTVRQMAEELGITDRHIVRILRDLVEARMIDVCKVGARNVYRVRGATRLRHHTMSSSRVQDLVDLFVANWRPKRRAAASPNGAAAVRRRGPRPRARPRGGTAGVR